MMTQSWVEPIYQLRQEIGLPPLVGHPLIDDKHSPYLTLALFSSVLAKPQPDWPQNTVIGTLVKKLVKQVYNAYMMTI